MFKDFFFEYFYYRVFYFFNYQSDGSDTRSFRSAIVISLVQSVYAMNVLKFARDLWSPEYVLKPGVAGYIGLPFMIVLAIYNFKKYNGKIEEFEKRWDIESGDHRFIKGLLIIITIILPFIPLFFFNHSPHPHP